MGEVLVRAGLACALAGTLLGVSPWHASLYALPKLALLAAGVALAWAGLAWRGAPESAGGPPPFWLPLAGCAAALSLSTLFSEDLRLSLWGQPRLYAYGCAPLALCAALYWACARAPERRGFILGVLAASAAALGAYGLLQAAGLDPLAALPAWPTRLPEGRVVSLQGSPVYLGSALCALLPLCVHLALMPGTRGQRALGAAAAGLAAAALAATLSRAAWLGASAGVALYAWARTGRGLRVGPRALALGAAALAALGGIALARRDASRSDSARVQLWLSSARIARARPLLGTGPDAFTIGLGREKTEGFVRALGPRKTQLNAHNDLLQAWATTGGLGLGAYLWLLAALARRLLGAAREPGERALTAAAAGSLAALFVQAKLNPAPLASLAVAAAAAALPGAEDRTPSRRAALGVCALCLLTLFGIARLLAGDHALRVAMAAQAAGDPEAAEAAYARAARLDPGALEPRVYAVNLLLERARRAGAAASREPLDRALAHAREAARRHPNEYDAQLLLGSTLLALRAYAGVDRLAEAEATLARARALDWSAPTAVENAMKAAYARGERERGDALARELERLRTLEPG